MSVKFYVGLVPNQTKSIHTVRNKMRNANHVRPGLILVQYCLNLVRDRTNIRTGHGLVELRKREILALGSLSKWPRRCKRSGGHCGVRRARTTTGTVVPGARYMCPRAIETPGACAARSDCHKLRTVPGSSCSAALQAPGAGAGGSPGACTMRAPAASPMEGTAPLLRGPRCAAEPDGQPRRDAGAQAGFPAVGPRGGAGAARARPAGRQRARGACWRDFWCGMWGMSTLSHGATS